jgi:nuclear cap-binding protein subunit 1
MPEKLTVYTTLAGLLNKADYDAGGEFVEMAVRQLKECIRSNEFQNARMLVSSLILNVFFTDIVMI